MVLLTRLNHLLTHQILISSIVCVFHYHLLLHRRHKLLRLNVPDRRWLNLHIVNLLLWLIHLVASNAHLNLLRLIFLDTQVYFLYFIRVGFQFVASLLDEAPVFICLVKFKVFIYVIAHLVLLFIFFLNILTPSHLLLARL